MPKKISFHSRLLLNIEYTLRKNQRLVMKPLQYYINMSGYHYTLEDIIHIGIAVTDCYPNMLRSIEGTAVSFPDQLTTIGAPPTWKKILFYKAAETVDQKEQRQY